MKTSMIKVLFGTAVMACLGCVQMYIGHDISGSILLGAVLISQTIYEVK